MTKNKITRLEDLEKRAKPKGKIVIIYEDPDQPDVFYDKQDNTPGRKIITDTDIKKLNRETPGGITVIKVAYDKKKE